MSQDDIAKATHILKQTVPLMMQHKVAATPPNYALWYTYVEQSNPDLNSSLDSIVKEKKPCTPSTNETLYKQYIAGTQETSFDELKRNLELMVAELSSTMNTTLLDSSDFSQKIDTSFAQLERVENEGLSMDQVMDTVRLLVKESKSIRHSTSFFTSQLNNATSEIAKLKQQLQEVQKDALFDALSGLYNRRAFDKDIQMLCASGDAFSLVLLDLDHFKKLNDDYSHLLGDAVIRAVANRLKAVSREGISAYRYGGEEFALIVPDKDLRIARHYAETARRSIEKIAVKDKQSGRSVSSITASFGVAEIDEKESALSLIGRADKLLYEAKQLGRNRVMPL
ncbi:GGDEF domain-containing protein [Vibrio ulleungensis]|uniref:diguanylate cyclase n=1 Tax=Vibrio ulleungensis TaxID=2807619 RepID=A0ABS2HEK8_9VIBR|nr:GGDEF domain-containing protein [Vibrio ulleungensis]MBM7036018.1 GGDEF domain-containing protein [Vibrio ulleungensis]